MTKKMTIFWPRKSGRNTFLSLLSQLTTALKSRQTMIPVLEQMGQISATPSDMVKELVQLMVSDLVHDWTSRELENALSEIGQLHGSVHVLMSILADEARSRQRESGGSREA